MLRIIIFIQNFGLIRLFLIFFAGVNSWTFFLYALDKHRAIKQKWRISEKTLLLFTLLLGGIGAFFAMTLIKHKNKKRKFKAAVVTGLIICLIPMVHVIHSLTLDRIIQFVEIDFYADNWPTELNGYRIAFMTDFHTITDEDMAAVVLELNGRDLDLLLLGGDFADYVRTAPHYQGTVREISQTVTTDGIFGVEGNHDNFERLFEIKRRYGITPLENNGYQIREGFYLAGVRDLWNDEFASIETAITDADFTDFILLVSHNPDIVMTQPTSNVDLVFSGHTHGGQITFFGYPFYLLRGSVTDYGTRFSHGFSYSEDGVPVFTSRGVGPYYNWPRIFARPEVVIFTMYAE